MYFPVRSRNACCTECLLCPLDSSGDLLQQLDLPNEIEEIGYLAVSSMPSNSALLVATTLSGGVYSWLCGPVTEPTVHSCIAPTENLNSSASVGNANGDPPSSQQHIGVENDGVEPFSVGSSSSHSDIESLLSNQLPVSRGFILLLGDETAQSARWLAEHTEFSIVSVLDSIEKCQYQQKYLHSQRVYGHRASVQVVPKGLDSLAYADNLFSAVVELAPSGLSIQELSRVTSPSSGRLFRYGQAMAQGKPLAQGSDSWRHLYAGPSNRSATRDSSISTAGSLKLQWFGGVGPQPMPDRHLRGHAPLAAGASMVLHGDGCLIGVDPFNGFQRWRLELPTGSMRYVIPYDCGYSCLDPTGARLFTATSESIWVVDPLTGKLENEISVPATEPEQTDVPLQNDHKTNYRFGFLVESGGLLFTSLMKQTAPRLRIDDQAEARQRYSDQDYRSGRPLVCSRVFACLDANGKARWTYQGGPIVNGTIALAVASDLAPEQPLVRVLAPQQDSPSADPCEKVIFIEARHPSCLAHETDRLGLASIIKMAYLVCLDAESGNLHWQCPIEWENCENILYTQIADGYVILVTSVSDQQP